MWFNSLIFDSLIALDYFCVYSLITLSHMVRSVSIYFQDHSSKKALNWDFCPAFAGIPSGSHTVKASDWDQVFLSSDLSKLDFFVNTSPAWRTSKTCLENVRQLRQKQMISNCGTNTLRFAGTGRFHVNTT